MRAMSAAILGKGDPRSADAQRCDLLGKTVLVGLEFPAMAPSASLSQGAVYVSRFQRSGEHAHYRVWSVQH
jgi:hypothetical protein